jgi:hypothetical protein
MLSEANRRFDGKENIKLINSSQISLPADYYIASGIFSVKLDTDNDTWLRYIVGMLDDMNRYAKRGFSFNCLTKYSDEDRKRQNLYYADPEYIFSHCKNNLSRNVALLHDYDLYEFTILVRK